MLKTDRPPYLDTAYELDARNVRSSDCVLLIGVTANPPNIKEPMDCGYCSYLTCERLSAAIKRKKASHKGPLCILQAVNLGIALGSAAKVASDLNVDQPGHGGGVKKVSLYLNSSIYAIELYLNKVSL